MNKELDLKITGMHCDSCASVIEDRLSRLKGVEGVQASYADESAKITIDEEKISESAIVEELNSIGYGIKGRESNAKGKTSAGKTSLKQGIIYGLLPHTGCIAFIAGSVLGVTFLTEFFRPLLMNRYFFYILIAISLAFATISSALYLRKQGLLSMEGAKRKWKYLSTMYGSTIGVNLLMFLVVFPLVANLAVASPSQSLTGEVTLPAGTGSTGSITSGSANVAGANLASLQLAVDIPCSGHASLITGELKKISGVSDVQFSFPNIFDVKYDASKTSKDAILALDVFKEYPAKVLSEALTPQSGQQAGIASLTSASGSAGTAGSSSGSVGGCCGGGGSCGGSSSSGSSAAGTCGSSSGGCGCGAK